MDKSIPQRIGRKKKIIRLIRIIEKRFITIPLETISGIFKNPEPKTTALGGVATGSIKAQEATVNPYQYRSQT